MIPIYWKRKRIISLPEERRDDLSLILPYWGLLLDGETNEILPGLANCHVVIQGLDQQLLREVSIALQHTGISFSGVEEQQYSSLHLTVSFKEIPPAQITFTLMNMTYYLKPLLSQSADLQKAIHKRIWLPVASTTYEFEVHPLEQQHIAEWLCYITIQSFLRSSFQSVSEILISDYRELVSTVLSRINPEFAQFQLENNKQIKEDWPEPPSDLTPSSKSNSLIKDDHSEEPFNPFKSNDNNHKEKFNPFKFQNNSKQTSIIKPFHYKKQS
ncbi:hypothetical protein [Pseudalkalibacillus hwajinpoensis]|uniref:Uncharacterized protein n=1 Tax=Guptibacillus hwajinpoensis TaxID=208199 RepID=A0A4U1MME9_9BACL|nr:hypothetical protein [Pseudalkalibacillus hwajinpoensis]TKD71856.1 hypothetical protein FBF83_03385 [Pseudalkalibacillus hwajinpoensis]